MNGSNSPGRITADTLVCDIVAAHPQTVLVFVRHRLHCPGCYMAPFHTLTDTAREYQVAVAHLLRDLNRAVANDAD
jgi:hybrid cluster-associated redox disulfide protein